MRIRLEIQMRQLIIGKGTAELLPLKVYCLYLLQTKLQIRGGIEDNSKKFFFLISLFSHRKHML